MSLAPSTLRLDQQPKPLNESGDGADVDLSDNIVASPPSGATVIEIADGSVRVSFGGDKPPKDIRDEKFDANLADSVAQEALGTICEELLQGIEQDKLSRKEWEEQRAEGIKWLAVKIESPTSDSGSSAAGQTNLSRTRHTMLLETVLRFQANARGEFLPTDGPVKVESKMAQDSVEADERAQRLEDDFNYYMTEVATEYYPDTDRMMFWVGFGGIGFKKVYRCPVRRRPVSESIDAKNVIVSNGATDLLNADRVTIEIEMPQSTMKRMRAMGVYRDIELGLPSGGHIKSSIDEEEQAVTGIMPSMRPEDLPYGVYECYAQIELPGDEGPDKGVPRPYKVTIERDTRQVLDIRRNWKQGDPLERRRPVIIDFPFVPAFGIYALGLMNIIGNPTAAATALQRVMIDAGIFGNFPSFLIAKGSNKQNTTDMVVPPGAGYPIDTSMSASGDIRQIAMPMPYHEAGPAIFNLFNEIVQTGSRVGGAADTAVGEGRQDAPVGTTIALIEQATKVVDAVHKRLHTSQSREFKLIRELFIEYPEDFIRWNQERDPKWDEAGLTQALNDFNLVPKADPNTASQTQRIMRAQAIFMMMMQAPEMFNKAVGAELIMRAIGVNNPGAILADPSAQGQQPPPLKDQAAMIQAQTGQQNLALKAQDIQSRMKIQQSDVQNDQQQRHADLAVEADKLKGDALMHGQKLQAQMKDASMKQQGENQREVMRAHVDLASQAMQHRHDANMQAMQGQQDAQSQQRDQQHDQQSQVTDQAHQAEMQANAPKPARSGKAKGGRVAKPTIAGGRIAPDGHEYIEHEGRYFRVDHK